jgi:hypothetical protein
MFCTLSLKHQQNKHNYLDVDIHTSPVFSFIGTEGSVGGEGKGRLYGWGWEWGWGTYFLFHLSLWYEPNPIQCIF